MSRANKRWFRKKSIFSRGMSFDKSFSKKNMFSQKRHHWGRIAFICSVIICLVALCGYFYVKNKEIVKISIQIPDAVIRQDELLPEIKVDLDCEKESKTAQLFLEEIQSGAAYEIFTEGDLSQEGTYELALKWSDSIAEKLSAEWKSKIKVEISAGKLTVKNKNGDWDGNKFKKLDESYAVNEFITSKGKDYFFDAEGNKVSGEYKINGVTYYFSDEGVFDVEKNKLHPGKPMIALTFDDGPGLYTEDLLAIFEEHNSRATFFVLGQQVKSFPTSIKKMKELGCEIGNHTYAHKRLTELSEKDMKSQISKTNKALKEVIGEETKLVRPTYGAVNSAVRKYVKYPFIMWSLDTEDWKLKDATKISELILSEVEDGDIVLMHDIHEFTFEAMKIVIPELVSRGYQLVTVSELASTHGVTFEKGTKYFEF